MLLAAVALLLASCSGNPPDVAPTDIPTPSEVPTTPTTAAAPLTFVVIGDWGAGTAAQRAIATRMCASLPFAFVLTTGDNFYAPDGVATQRTFYGPERCLLQARVPWKPVWGNHDAGASSTASVLGAPRRYYHFVAGGVAFFMLDSNNPGGAAQRAWLEQKLSAATQRVKIVAFHHPPFTASLHDPSTAVRTAWVSLFERYNVTLVLSGHNHVYEHHVVGGIDYVVTGGGGQSLYPCKRAVQAPDRCVVRHHFLKVLVAVDSVTVSALTEEGKYLDNFSVRA